MPVLATYQRMRFGLFTKNIIFFSLEPDPRCPNKPVLRKLRNKDDFSIAGVGHADPRHAKPQLCECAESE
jgi:hypothetical protein